MQRAGGGAHAQLPAAYVQAHIELGYACTAHRAQGRTVDTAHACVSAATIREPLYVMAIRGRESNRLYVDTTFDPDVATSHEDATPSDPVEVLEAAIRTSGADLSATASRHAEEEGHKLNGASWRRGQPPYGHDSRVGVANRTGHCRLPE